MSEMNIEIKGVSESGRENEEKSHDESELCGLLFVKKSEYSKNHGIVAISVILI